MGLSSPVWESEISPGEALKSAGDFSEHQRERSSGFVSGEGMHLREMCHEKVKTLCVELNNRGVLK